MMGMDSTPIMKDFVAVEYPGAITIVSRNSEEPIKRLRNWYYIDNKRKDIDNFAWGYGGEGPTCTAYSILRELFGRDFAEMYYQYFLDGCISKLRQEQGFLLCEREICELMKARRFTQDEADCCYCETLKLGFAPGIIEKAKILVGLDSASDMLLRKAQAEVSEWMEGSRDDSV